MKQRTAVLYVRLRPEVRARLAAVAEAAGVTLSDAADIIISRGLGMDTDETRLAAALRDTPNAT